MSSPGVTTPKMTADEYLAFERASETKHEFRDGEIVAMSGASYAHNLVASNFLRALGNALEGRPCRALGSDMRVKVGAARLYTYPDIVVHCDEPLFDDEQFDTLLNPKLIVEVLSDSTEAYDRGGKFKHYRRLATLSDLVLASQKEPLLEQFSRHGDGLWRIGERGPGEQLSLPALGIEVAVDEIYRGVFPQPDVAE